MSAASWPFKSTVPVPWIPDAVSGLLLLAAALVVMLFVVRDRKTKRDGMYLLLFFVAVTLARIGRVFFALAEGEDRLRRGGEAAAKAARNEVREAYSDAVWIEKEAVL